MCLSGRRVNCTTQPCPSAGGEVPLNPPPLPTPSLEPGGQIHTRITCASPPPCLSGLGSLLCMWVELSGWRAREASPAVSTLILSPGVLRAHLSGLAGCAGETHMLAGWLPWRRVYGGRGVCWRLPLSLLLTPVASCPPVPTCGPCEVARLRQSTQQCCPEYECGTCHPAAFLQVHPQPSLGGRGGGAEGDSGRGRGRIF